MLTRPLPTAPRLLRTLACAGWAVNAAAPPAFSLPEGVRTDRRSLIGISRALLVPRGKRRRDRWHANCSRRIEGAGDARSMGLATYFRRWRRSSRLTVFLPRAPPGVSRRCRQTLRSRLSGDQGQLHRGCMLWPVLARWPGPPMRKAIYRRELVSGGTDYCGQRSGSPQRCRSGGAQVSGPLRTAPGRISLLRRPLSLRTEPQAAAMVQKATCASTIGSPRTPCCSAGRSHPSGPNTAIAARLAP